MKFELVTTYGSIILKTLTRRTHKFRRSNVAADNHRYTRNARALNPDEIEQAFKRPKKAQRNKATCPRRVLLRGENANSQHRTGTSTCHHKPYQSAIHKARSIRSDKFTTKPGKFSNRMTNPRRKQHLPRRLA